MVESSKDNIAKTVKRLRGQIGLLQEKLAPLVDVSNNTIINIETRLYQQIINILRNQKEKRWDAT